MQVVGEAENGRTAVELARKLLPDVVVIDISMPDLNGVEATRQLLADNPKVKVLVLSMHSDKRFVAQMLRAGALGYVLKECAFEELIRAIASVVANHFYLCPAITRTVVGDYVRSLPAANSSVFSVLTSREREVLQLIAEGGNTKGIASRLGISVKTVETHRQRLMKKLNLNSLAELIKYAIREGLTSLEE
jgi:DNA-binding NarL/FixJ family response regulator